MLLGLIDSSQNGGRLDTKPGCAMCVTPFIIYLGSFPPEQKHILVFNDHLKKLTSKWVTWGNLWINYKRYSTRENFFYKKIHARIYHQSLFYAAALQTKEIQTLLDKQEAAFKPNSFVLSA